MYMTMYHKIILLIIVSIISFSCSKKEVEISDNSKTDGFKIYYEAIKAMDENDFFYAASKFAEAELILPKIEYSAKALLMSSYCYYTINFYPESLEGLEKFIVKYPASKDIPYAHYLMAISFYEQILDETKDIAPLIKTKEKILFYIKTFPDSEYAMDLKFKLDLVNNQLGAKELYIAKYYIKQQKWIAAINRLKIIVKDYDQTIFIEEALHRLVEVYYRLGLEEEANAAAATLGYNYNSSEWYEQSYKLLNKKYVIKKKKKKSKENSLIERTIKKILN